MDELNTGLIILFSILGIMWLLVGINVVIEHTSKRRKVDEALRFRKYTQNQVGYTPESIKVTETKSYSWLPKPLRVLLPINHVEDYSHLSLEEVNKVDNFVKPITEVKALSGTEKGDPLGFKVSEDRYYANDKRYKAKGFDT